MALAECLEELGCLWGFLKMVKRQSVSFLCIGRLFKQWETSCFRGIATALDGIHLIDSELQSAFYILYTSEHPTLDNDLGSFSNIRITISFRMSATGRQVPAIVFELCWFAYAQSGVLPSMG